MLAQIIVIGSLAPSSRSFDVRCSMFDE